MIYKLKQGYKLRGWNKMAWVLIHYPKNEYKTLSVEEFQVLLLCDGKTDLKNYYITDEMIGILEHLEGQGIVEICINEASLDEDQYYRYYDNRFVGSVFWSITGKCNFKCRHCYMDAPKGIMGELSHEEAINLIDQMAECGVLRVDITGGEPLLRNDFWQLVDRIQSYKMTIGQIYTNGWMVTQAVLDELEKREMTPEFCFSFDGVGWHDWMRGTKGAEEATLEALKICIKRGFRVNTVMCLHRGNQNTLRKTVKVLADIGVSMTKISNISMTNLWEKNSDGNALNIREYTEAMINYIPQFFQDGMPMEIMLGGVVLLHKGSRGYKDILTKCNGVEECENCLLCGAARYSCYITPEGRLLPCMPMTACKEQEKFPLIQDIGLKQGLSDSLYMDIVDSRVRDLLKANPQCATCEYRYKCGGGCRATALEQTGDLMGCDGDQCILWKEGYVDRIRQVTEEAIAKYCTNDEGIS